MPDRNGLALAAETAGGSAAGAGTGAGAGLDAAGWAAGVVDCGRRATSAPRRHDRVARTKSGMSKNARAVMVFLDCKVDCAWLEALRVIGC